MHRVSSNRNKDKLSRKCARGGAKAKPVQQKRKNKLKRVCHGTKLEVKDHRVPGHQKEVVGGSEPGLRLGLELCLRGEYDEALGGEEDTGSAGRIQEVDGREPC